MSKKRRFIWARFVFWVGIFLLNCNGFGSHLSRPDWWLVLFLAAMVLSLSYANAAWTELERTA